MQRIGYDPASGMFVDVRFDEIITVVDSLIEPVPDSLYIAPGWIDVQVNGYAAVDYNSPDTPIEEIARSVRVLHSTGTTRFYPTVITGTAENMTNSLRNLARAKALLPSIEGFH